MPVTFSARGPERADGSRAMLAPDDFRYAGYGEVSKRREVQVAGLHFGRSLPLVPFREPSAWFSSLDPEEIVASTDRRRPFTDDGRRAHVGFGLASRLYLALAPQPDAGGDFRGQLVVLGDDDAGLSELDPGPGEPPRLELRRLDDHPRGRDGARGPSGAGGRRRGRACRTAGPGTTRVRVPEAAPVATARRRTRPVDRRPDPPSGPRRRPVRAAAGCRGPWLPPGPAAPHGR